MWSHRPFSIPDTGFMEQRTHPRIQLPLLVEVQHPSIGRRRCTARDVSEGGLFVQVSDHSINVGAKLKITTKAIGEILSESEEKIASLQRALGN